MREWVERALAVGKRLQSEETGWVHCLPPKQGKSDSIPVVENMLYILALFRSRIGENILEAKEKLSQLLCFQNRQVEESEGNFPVFLHHYPLCRDRLLGFHLLAPLTMIQKQFGPILGEKLRGELSEALALLSTYAERIIAEKRVPFAIQYLWKGWKGEKGETPPQELSFADWGLILLAEQLRGGTSPFPLKWWRADWQCVVGPGWQEFREEERPQFTLLHLFLSAGSTLPAVYSEEDPLWLQAALVYPRDVSFASVPLPVEEKQFVSTERYAYSFLPFSSPLDPHVRRGRCFWKLVWKAHSLVAQGGNVEAFWAEVEGNRAQLFFRLGEPPPFQERKKCKELCLFLNRSEEVSLSIEGTPATTFSLGQKVCLETDSLSCTLLFSLVEGEGKWMGHLMPGNRLGQLALQGEKRFEAYDWQLFLRTLSRERSCVIKVDLEIL